MSAAEIGNWASKYIARARAKTKSSANWKLEHEIETRIVPAFRKKARLTKPDFLTIYRWKTPRSANRVCQNSPQAIDETIAVAVNDISAPERTRIGTLLMLEGVSWPTASAFLHWLGNDPYPVLDFRALWSLYGWPTPPSYSFKIWIDYVELARTLSKEYDVSMRTLDRALWQYSKEKQPSK
jgi:thermostable 8-oxoguanine DNA glycosylase